MRWPTKRQWWWIGGLSTLGIAVVGALAVVPLTRAKLASEAAERGLTVSVETVRPVLTGVELEGVQVSSPYLPGLRVTVESVRVEVGLGLSPRRVVVQGGSVVVRGSREELERQLEQYRKQFAGHGKDGAGRGQFLPVLVGGIGFAWQTGSSGTLSVSQLGYRREGTGEEQVSWAGAEATRGTATVRLGAGRASFAHSDGSRTVRALQVGSLTARLDLDALGASMRVKRASSGPGDDAVPALGEPVDGTTLPGLPIDAGRSARVRGTLRRLREVVMETLPKGAALAVERVELELQRGGERLHIGPSRLDLARRADSVELELVPNARAQRTPLSLSLSFPLTQRPVTAKIEGGPVTLAALGVGENQFGLRHVSRSSVEVAARAAIDGDARELRLSGKLTFHELGLAKPAIAKAPIEGLNLALSGAAVATVDGKRITVEHGELGMGQVRIQATGTLERDATGARIALSGGVAEASCQAMLASTPAALLPLMAGFELSGTFGLSSELELDTHALEHPTVALDVMNQCRVTRFPPAVDPRRFLAPWTRTVRGADGRDVEIVSGPGSEDWVDYEHISRHMETAVLVCEDGRFFRHRGFDEEAIENSVKENLRLGRFARGASTISMQLAKNLYLSRDKTLSRKFQEALLTLLLEQELSKQEIMELYLNVIEFGPGIYGIGAASQYYFQSRASDLTLAQALYLGSILPNPARQHLDPDGRVTERWTSYLRQLMAIAKKIKRISEEEYELGIEEQVVFGRSDTAGDDNPDIAVQSLGPFLGPGLEAPTGL